MKSSEDLVQLLLSKVFTTKTLKDISASLEELTQDKSFRLHLKAITEDDSLTDSQRRRQLKYILRVVDNPILQDFFDEVLAKKQEWLFSRSKLDYFDKFVQHFQLATENVGLVYLVTAVELTPAELQAIALDLSQEFGYPVILKHEINSSIIGGVQVRVENLVFDYSVKTKLQQFQQAWLASLTQTEKKIGRNQADFI